MPRRRCARGGVCTPPLRETFKRHAGWAPEAVFTGAMLRALRRATRLVSEAVLRPRRDGARPAPKERISARRSDEETPERAMRRTCH